jgi:hypothetical protein
VGTKIGVQTNHWNKWTGTYTPTGAQAAKNANTISADLLASKFEVSNPINTIWNPTYVLPRTGWFEPLTTATPEVCSEIGDCSPTTISQDGSSSRVAAISYATGQSQVGIYGEYHTWSGRRWVLKMIPSNPTWLSDASINTFKVEYQNSNLAKLNQIDVLFSDFNTSNDKNKLLLTAIYAEIETNTARLNELSGLLAENPTREDSITYMNERKTVLSEQAGMMYRIEEIYVKTRFERVAKISAAQALNNQIVPSNVFETNEKIINQIYLNTKANDDSLSTEDKAVVTRIASLCPMIGGTAVFKARHLYGYFAIASFDDVVLCRTSSTPPIEGKFAATNMPEVSIYPNPVRDELSIVVATNEPVTAILLDVTGRTVLQQAFTSNTQLSTINLPNGAYFCEIWKGNQKIKTEKLSVIH